MPIAHSKSSCNQILLVIDMTLFIFPNRDPNWCSYCSHILILTIGVTTFLCVLLLYSRMEIRKFTNVFVPLYSSLFSNHISQYYKEICQTYLSSSRIRALTPASHRCGVIGLALLTAACTCHSRLKINMAAFVLPSIDKGSWQVY